MLKKWNGFIGRLAHRFPGWNYRPGSGAMFDTLDKSYISKGRRYHTWQHINSCLSLLKYVPQGVQKLELEAAIWFHDAVYDPRASDNEEKSAALAANFLSDVDPKFAQTVFELILATAHLRPVPGRAEDSITVAYLLDIDLAVLGARWMVFRRYERGIRYEYRHLGQATYRDRRVQVVQTLAAKKPIYRTEYFEGKYEKRAVRNLARLIATLSRR